MLLLIAMQPGVAANSSGFRNKRVNKISPTTIASHLCIFWKACKEIAQVC